MRLSGRIDMLRSTLTCIALGVGLYADAALAVTVAYTSQGTGNWSTAGTWTPVGGPPDSDDNVTIKNGNEVTANTAGLLVRNLTVGSTTSGIFTLDGGSLLVDFRIAVSAPTLGGAGTLNIKSGTLNYQANGTSGDLNYNSTNSRAFRLGYNGSATINQTGGIINYTVVNDFADYGTSAYSPGPVAFNLTGGTFQTTANYIEFGGSANGSVVTWTIGGGAGTALFHQSAGINGMFSKGGKTTVDLKTNGTLQIYGFGVGPSSLGNGGTSDSSFNFDGGTLSAKAANDLLPGTIFTGGTRASVYVKEGGAILNSNGFNPSISAVLKHGGVAAIDGGVQKIGSGTWTLSAANTHTGDTLVTAGTLALGNVNAVQSSTLDTGTSGSQSVTFTVAGTNTYNLGGLKGSDALAIGANTISVGANGQSTNYSGVLSGSGGLTKVGAAGTLTLAGLNTYSGATNITNGTLSADKIVVSGGNSSLGNAASAVILGSAGSQGTLQYTGAAATYTRGFTINAGGGRLINAGGELLTVSSGAIAAGGLFTVGGATGNDIYMTSVVSGAGGLAKTGGNTVTLAATNLYNGATTVSGGTLSLGTSGSLNNSAVTVQNGGTFAGSGSVKSLNVQVGGFHRPGNSPGITTVNGDYTMAGTLVIEIDGTAGAGLVGGHDQVVVNNDGDGSLVTLSGLLSVDPAMGLSLFDTFTIIDNNGGSPISGVFSGLAEGASFWASIYQFSITYVGGAGNDVVLTVSDIQAAAVPEPSSLGLLGGLAALALWSGKRKRRRSEVAAR